MTPPINAAEIERFWAKVRKSDGCWEWVGTKNRKGYGRIRIRSRDYAAHRISWLLSSGKDAGKMFVCHHCDTPSCVRPDHLFLGTAKDNANDSARKKRTHAQSKTHCPRGHEYTPENTWMKLGRGKRHRICLTCKKVSDSEYSKARRRADSSVLERERIRRAKYRHARQTLRSIAEKVGGL